MVIDFSVLKNIRDSHRTVDVFSAIHSLQLSYKGTPNSKGWLSIICPFHNDKDFGNASLNIHTGIITCFNCKTSKHISSLLKKENVKVEYKKEVEKPKPPKKQPIIFDYIGIDLNPDKHTYTRVRGFTKQFCKSFGIKHCFSPPYLDYMMIPIVDTHKGINEYEFRKVVDSNCPDYIKAKKVRYVSNSRVKETLWNIDNLDYKKDLYVTEGLGSIPKIYENISKNVTCLFGGSPSKEQIEYLEKFNKIIFIPDKDLGGFEMIKSLHRQGLANFEVIDTIFEDTHKEYVDVLRTTIPICYNEFIRNNFIFYELKKRKVGT